MEKYNLILLKVSIAFAIISIFSLVMFGITSQSSAHIYWFAFAISVTFITTIAGAAQVFIGVRQVFNNARNAREVGTNSIKRQTYPLKVTLEVNGDPITIESSDTEQIGEILKLIQELQTSHPLHSHVEAEPSSQRHTQDVAIPTNIEGSTSERVIK